MPTEYFESRERALLGERYDALYAAPENPARGLTANTLRTTRETLMEKLPYPLEVSAFCPQGLLLRDAQVKPGRHPYHHAGAYYVQEPSASAPAALLEARPGHRVLDLCAAPGGKSSQLAAALAGQGILVSNEFVAGRADILKNNLERMGAANAIVLNEAPARIASALPGWFDRVLVDAPCSGEGMFRKEPQALAQHNVGLVRQCAALGAEILEAAATALAPGGILVYSTCTFAPQEDEGQIGAFLEKHPEFSLLPTTEAFGSPGEVNRWEGTPYAVEYTRRIWPCQGGEGHFMAKLQKRADAPREAPCKSKPNKPAKAPAEWLTFAKTYFPTLAARPVLTVGDNLLLPPENTPALPGLRIVRGGVLAGSITKGRFVPGHHLFMAFGTDCANTEPLTLEDARTESWLRGEEIPALSGKDGWCAVLVDGMPLGCGKISGGKVKNHYPKALRNLK